MNSKLKVAALTVGAAAFLNLTAVGQAVAVWCAADAAIIYGKITGSTVPFLGQIISATGLSTERTVIESGAATRAEVLKSAAANKAVEEGLESYRQQEELRNEAQDLRDKLKAPATTCQTIAASTALSAGAKNAQVRAFSSQAKSLAAVTSNPNTVQTIDTAHQATNRNFCTAEEAARGVCTVNNGRYANLAGADSDAMFLFQSRDGSASYEGVNNSPQAEATDAYIQRVLAGIPPEDLRDKGEAYYQRNPQARAYIELQRRYNAMISASAYSLAQIQEAHRTQAGLGRDTMLDTISAPGYAANKTDMSMAEAVERFVATKFSAEAVKDLGVARQPHLILRDMAQVESFQLWLAYQQMLQSGRRESLLAHQLALQTEHVLRPQIEAQRSAAMRAAGAR
jgi:hypothetical protein